MNQLSLFSVPTQISFLDWIVQTEEQDLDEYCGELRRIADKEGGCYDYEDEDQAYERMMHAIDLAREDWSC